MMTPTIRTTGLILGLAFIARLVAQETAAIAFDMRNCWDCEVLTLEGAVAP